MEALYLILCELYPTTNWEMKKQFTSEPHRVRVGYNLRIDGLCDKWFKTTKEMEEFVHNLYKLEIVREAEEFTKEKKDGRTSTN